MATVSQTLDRGHANTIPDAMRRVSLGAILAGLVPRRIARTGLVSGATHVEPEAGALLIVALADGAALIQIENGTAGAGEVLVVYNAQGVATLTFGDGAQTAYRVVKTVLPANLATNLAANNGDGG